MATVLLHGVPDDRAVRLIRTSKAGEPGFRLEGTASFYSSLRSSFPGWVESFIGPGFDLRPESPSAPIDLVNHIADADRCRSALELASRLADSNRGGCFNHPEAVLRTTRDANARKFADSASTDIPRTVRTRPRMPEDLLCFAREQGLQYPLLVRIAGDHGGVSIVRIDSPRHWYDLSAIPWGGRELYLTEYREFRDPDGHYRKMRVVVVGEEYFPRHLVIGNSWLLHAERRAVKDHSEEAAFLANFDKDTRPRIDAAVREIIRRTGLDYFGIDASLRPDGRLLVFEVNACMKVLSNSEPSPNIWDAPIERIREALIARLGAPQTWVRPPTS